VAAIDLDVWRPAFVRSSSMSSEFDARRNSLGFLRWLFAALVVIDHSYPIAGLGSGSDPTWRWSRGQDSLGGIAVAGFFVISGFLVTRSWFGSRSPIRYLWRRFIRIFPGFWVCLVVTACVFAPLAWRHEHGGLTGVFSVQQDSALHYVSANFWLHMHQWNVANLLSGTPYRATGYPLAWDGSLWTLIYEFKCYLVLGVLGLAGVLRHRRAIVAFTVIAYAAMLSWQVNPGWAPKILPLFGDVYVARFLFLFFLGSLFALFVDEIVLDDRIGVLAVLLAVVTLHEGGWFLIGYPALAYATMWFASRFPMSWFDRPGDFSYGTYIYAFPIQMLLAEYGLQRHGAVVFVVASVGGATIAAILSWHLVEKHALKLKNWQPMRNRTRPRWQAAAEPKPLLAPEGPVTELSDAHERIPTV
jgi:peptidoglycan/LPS O-acetylase OafA/YrhL